MIPKFTKLNVEKVVSHVADFFAFLVHKVVCFKFFMHYVELFVTIIHVLYMPLKSELWSVCWF